MYVEKKSSGAFLKSERLRRGLLQKEIAQGACTVSYLSRIENEEVVPHKDLMTILLSRLGFRRMEKQEERIVKERLESFFASVASNEQVDSSLLEEIRQLAEGSEYEPYLHLAEFFCSDEKSMEINQDSLSREALCLYYCVLSEREEDRLKALEHARRSIFYSRNSTSLLTLFFAHYRLGILENTDQILEEAENLALDEGRLLNLLQAAHFKATKSALRPSKAMIPLYERALRIAESVKGGEREACMIRYNYASSLLEIGEYESSWAILSTLKDAGKGNRLLYHKRILAAIGTGDLEQAEKNLALFQNQESEDETEEKIKKQITMRLALLKMKRNPLLEVKYLQLLEDLYLCLKKNENYSYLTFYAKEYIEALKLHRMYKKALEVEEEIFLA